jgi:acyl dehydratase
MASEKDYSEELGHRTVTGDAVARFGCLTGDYARMHFDLSFGKSVDMGGPIAHGLLSAAWSLGALTLHAPERLALGRSDAYLAGFQIRFSRMVQLGDRFSLRWRNGHAGSGGDGVDALSTRDTDFEVLNQRGEATCSGGLSVCIGDSGAPPESLSPPEPMPVESWSAEGLTSPLYAEDLPERGPRGVSLGRTLTEADVVAYAGFSGELNPLYLNEELAQSGPFGARIVPPMLTFCLGFGDYLRELLRAPLPSAGFSGHLGDSWRFLAPVHPGDTIRARHAPIDWEPSKSRPGMAIVRFALQLQNQRDEIVQDGSVAMMMPTRDAT